MQTKNTSNLSPPYKPMSNQPKPMSLKLPNRALAMKLLMGTTIGGSLLGLAGLTLTGTMTVLLIAIPGLVLFSPILITAVIVLSFVTIGFLFSGGFLAASLAVMTWMYRYVAGKQLPWVGELDYGRMKRDVNERAKETQEQVQGS